MDEVLRGLHQVILGRKDNAGQGSYTGYLFAAGLDKILKKCGEECSEMIIAAKNDDPHELAGEIADLLYHVLVLCAQKELPLKAVEDILRERGRKAGNLKVPHVTDKNS